jgi:hypothetical protein
MDAFSYLSVLLSIIIGLGVTQVLTASGRLIRHRDRVRVDWLPLLWAAILLVIYVQVWWSMFGLRQQAEWTFWSFLVVLLQTTTLYVMAALVLPEQVDEMGVSLAEFYERQHRWFFGFLLTTLVISVVKDVVLSGHLPTALNLVFHGIFAAACLSAILIRGRRWHAFIGISSAVAMATYIGLLFGRLH